MDRENNFNYYEILGVSKNATETQIKKAFRKGTHIYYPNKQIDDYKKQHEKFIKMREAYEILSNSEKRKIYDLHGVQGLQKITSTDVTYNIDILKELFLNFNYFSEEINTNIKKS